MKDTSEIERIRMRRTKLSRALAILSEISKAPELIPVEDHSETITTLERKKKLDWGNPRRERNQDSKRKEIWFRRRY